MKDNFEIIVCENDSVFDDAQNYLSEHDCNDISFVDEFLPQGNDMYLPTYKNTWEAWDDYSIDINAAFSGYISVSPLTLDRTNMAVFEELVKLNL